MNAIALLFIVGMLFILLGMSILYYNNKMLRRLPSRSIDEIWEEAHDYRASIQYIQQMNQISYQEAKRVLVCHVLKEDAVFDSLSKHAFCVEACIADMKSQYVFDQYALQERVLEIHRKYQQDNLCFAPRLKEESQASVQEMKNALYEALDFVKKANTYAQQQEFHSMRQQLFYANQCIQRSADLCETLKEEDLEQFVSEFIVLKEICYETIRSANHSYHHLHEACDTVQRLIKEMDMVE